MRDDIAVFEEASQLVVEGGMKNYPLPQRIEQFPQRGFRMPLKQGLKLFHSL
ncbi:hypothetical protein [Caballeronia sp. LZ043]|uniref:hypothetical protein n=1 Tax=Caballeronia sp. LZ043 TaxID=3038569 RepID=UPI002863C2A5|nr:hypothetical protein [Caballeronia sp. LZ043]MDR5826159.1 hypothetical protein [Caballeronia sp. LZ043]